MVNKTERTCYFCGVEADRTVVICKGHTEERDDICQDCEELEKKKIIQDEGCFLIAEEEEEEQEEEN